MKIAIPVDDKTMESNICISFGRTPYFLIYDTKTKESVFVDNSAAVSQGGAGIKAAQIIVDSQVGALITPRCGENAAEVIQVAKIQIYKSKNNSIKDNIDAIENGKLSLLEDIHAGFHGGE
jgi:predicted Fe-Mo cluster-binding NifX family protein